VVDLWSVLWPVQEVQALGALLDLEMGVSPKLAILVNKRAWLVQPGPVGLLTRLARLGFLTHVLGLLQGA
jgi:hypothetical protein